jgi:hypothetical protein
LNLKLILYCFESMSGLKINYHKSEVYVVGGDQKVKEEIAGKLNCKLGQIPRIYLGIPIHTKKLRQIDFVMVTEKVAKRTDPWQGKLISSSGRLILVNSCLSSILVYMMGFYHLTDGQHKKMDSIRGRFFRQGGRKKFKYHMDKWDSLTVPKEFGGLEILNTRMMNDCLLVKWIWRIVNREDPLWCRILYKKYMQDKDFVTPLVSL